MIDEVYGDYPFLLYQNYFIARRNITKFCKQMTSINQRLSLSIEDRNTIEYMETLIIERLHIVTVSITSTMSSPHLYFEENST